MQFFFFSLFFFEFIFPSQCSYLAKKVSVIILKKLLRSIDKITLSKDRVLFFLKKILRISEKGWG